MFDTVAALGTKGARRFGIKTFLIGGSAALGAAVAAMAAVIITGIEYGVSDSWSWRLFFALIGIGALIGGAAVAQTAQHGLQDDPRLPEPGRFQQPLCRMERREFRPPAQPFRNLRPLGERDRRNPLRFHARHMGAHRKNAPEVIDGHKHFRQWWFAGNHSDIGGSYPETESRLSDIALEWMIEEATAIPNGLKVGPVFAGGRNSEYGRKGPAAQSLPRRRRGSAL